MWLRASVWTPKGTEFGFGESRCEASAHSFQRRASSWTRHSFNAHKRGKLNNRFLQITEGERKMSSKHSSDVSLSEDVWGNTSYQLNPVFRHYEKKCLSVIYCQIKCTNTLLYNQNIFKTLLLILCVQKDLAAFQTCIYFIWYNNIRLHKCDWSE